MKILELLMRETLPQRNFFHASEVCDVLKIKPHEMHYWESEFPQVRPQKTSAGKRIYRRHDVILFSAIKHLLQEKKLTLTAAQRIIAESDDIFVTENHVPPKIAAPIAVSEQKPADLLLDAARLLEDKEVNNSEELACNSDEISLATPVTDNNVGLLIHEAKKSSTMSTATYEKTVRSLNESKHKLTEIIGMLDKYHESNFWRGFNG